MTHDSIYNIGARISLAQHFVPTVLSSQIRDQADINILMTHRSNKVT